MPGATAGPRRHRRPVRRAACPSACRRPRRPAPRPRRSSGRPPRAAPPRRPRHRRPRRHCPARAPPPGPRR
ncbi:hypothetical protein D7X32_15990 [Corallococcus carmarthensis]|uniref:Uncharacterized protein n=1 Tax=Corallococcus carmarthensis TaxID=2316728 RepID=A0A3A8K5N3_9BACT|nr:hypothetical protein D7X32_15990 [Corallococcus carmarthensis]